MKRLKKLFKKQQEEHQASPTRITNETVAAHRERILAGGRRFKYPVQYARHKLVINTIIISVTSVILLVALAWLLLYPLQGTGTFLYRFTQLVPVPVASVDGELVRYSDYLVRYRSSLHFLQQQNMINIFSEDGQRQIDFIKREALNTAVESAYARKIANERGITVSREEVDAFINEERDGRDSALSPEAYESVVLRGFYDWSLNEYRSIVHDMLLQRKVAFAVDEPARERIEGIAAQLRQGVGFKELASEVSDDEATRQSGGDVGFVPAESQDPNGLIEVASNLKKNQISEIIEGVDGFYIIRLTDTRDNQIRYERIKIELSEFDKILAEVVEAGKTQEFINVPKDQEAENR